MRIGRWMVGVGSVAALVLVARAASMAQKFDRAPVLMLAPQADTKADLPRWKPAVDPYAVPPQLPAPEAPPGLDPTTILPAAGPAVGADPLGAVDAFVSKARQEADGSIEALSREAATLRARLGQVEAALARWQAVADALKREARPAGPTEPPASVPELPTPFTPPGSI